MGTTNQCLVEFYNDEEATWVIPDLDDMFVLPLSYRKNERETTDAPFCYQSYAIAAFIAGTRNYYQITPIAEPRGYPKVEQEQSESSMGFWACFNEQSVYENVLGDDGVRTWILLSELTSFDYEQVFEDRRSYTGSRDTVDVGEGTLTTYREHLGEDFFNDLDVLKSLGKDHDKVRLTWCFS